MRTLFYSSFGSVVGAKYPPVDGPGLPGEPLRTLRPLQTLGPGGYLSEPAADRAPRMNWRCNTRKKIITGRVVNVTAAAIPE